MKCKPVCVVPYRHGCAVQWKSTRCSQNWFVDKGVFHRSLKQTFFALLTPYLSIDHNLVASHGLSVTTSGGLAPALPLAFSAISQLDGHGTAGTAADVQPVIPQSRVSRIAFALENLFGTMVQYCLHDASLGPNLAAILYIKLPLISNYIPIPMVFDISRFYCTRHAQPRQRKTI